MITYSILIVTYFHEKYIRQALESVLCQKTTDQYEILIGDDGSTDGTLKILEEYSKQYPFIHVFAHENKGLSENIYMLLKKAQGRYIAILEGDDYWIDEYKLEKQKNIIETNDCIATCCNCIKKDNQGNILGHWNNWKFSRVLSKKEVLYYQTEVCHPSGIMLKNIFINSGDRYDLIKNASRMGGNHTGMINLLSCEGGLFYDEISRFVWRVVISESGKNYSSHKHNSVMDYYDAMKKYEVYDKQLKYNFERHIFEQYRACLRLLKEEFIKTVGVKRFMLAKIKYQFYRIKKKLSKKG